MSADSDMEYSDNECEYDDDDYYNEGEDCDVERIDPRKTDPELFQYDCLTVEEVEKLLNESVEKLNTILQITPSLAKVLLLEHQWNIESVVMKYKTNASALLIAARVKPSIPPINATSSIGGSTPTHTSSIGSASTTSATNHHLNLNSKECLLVNNSNNKTTLPSNNKYDLTIYGGGVGIGVGGVMNTPTKSYHNYHHHHHPHQHQHHQNHNHQHQHQHQHHIMNSSSLTNQYNHNNQYQHHNQHPHQHHNQQQQHQQQYRSQKCPVCITSQLVEKFNSLACGHSFCKDCWSMYFETQIYQGISTQIGCMAQDCNVRVPEDLVLTLVTRPVMRDKYQQFAFKDYVKSHPELRFCPGPNCQIIVRSNEVAPKRAICKSCTTVFCFKCGMDYHAPTDCQIIKQWLTKCADDSETANYISANTKDCPKCHICIEKNGGCNHMQCFNCKHDFCWMCLGDWKTHGSEYYECSRYKDNPNIANESVHVQAREALKKYLHYYERWENHSKSLQLEQQTLDRLKERINEKVMKGRGTWIDWQYLFNAASLLAKCRYTLQYTYPYAYYMEGGSRKDLFEYQQAQLEAEIENLSWKIERAEATDMGDLQNQMDIAEKRRTTLLKDFFPIDS